MKLVDTHAHLDFPQFEGDRAQVLEELRRQGMAVVNVGVDLRSSQASLELGRANGHVFASVGFHPHDAKAFTAEVEKRLEELAKAGAVAIGECGLDFYRDLSPRDAQVRAFRAQLRLAKRLDLPVILHERAAWEAFLQVLSEEGPVRGVVHAFSGDEARAQEVVRRGLYLGIGGPVTYPQNGRLRQALAWVPLDRVLLETDSPYLPPEPFRGQRNDPTKVRIVAETIARVLRRNLDEVAEITWNNARRLFGLKDRHKR